MRFSIDLTEACPLLSSFARRETRELENSSASFSIVRVKTAPAISSADHPTDSPPVIRVVRSLKRVDVAAFIPASARGTRWSPWRRAFRCAIDCLAGSIGSPRWAAVEMETRRSAKRRVI